LPTSFGKLTSLEVLTLDGCKLTSLPEEMVTMTRLMELNLGKNKKREIKRMRKKNKKKKKNKMKEI